MDKRRGVCQLRQVPARRHSCAVPSARGAMGTMTQCSSSRTRRWHRASSPPANCVYLNATVSVWLRRVGRFFLRCVLGQVSGC